MVHAIRIHQHGGPDALRWEPIEVAAPGPGQARIRHHAVGLNFIDTYHRTGLYPVSALPAVIGMEGTGEVLEIGDGVTEVAVGDRVAYVNPIGSYAQERLIAAERLVRLPESISYDTAAAMMLKGTTARYLLRQTYAVGPQTTMLFHAAAGGVGLIACQWARHLGATMIGTAGTDEKCARALESGATHVINYRRENFVDRVRELTGGAGCDVVYDSVGHDTFLPSLECLKPRGLFVSFGNASGPIRNFDLSLLAQKGSLYITRPRLYTYVDTREELVQNTSELFDVVTRGIVNIAAPRSYPLREAAQAHADLEARKTTGSTILKPE